MAADFASIRDQGTGDNDLPTPARNRRADFRSSGPKRLLPQLQIKVPSLRRWGKKMIVIVDAPFFNSLGPMEEVGDISNADIVWCVVDYQEQPAGAEAKLYVRGMVNTTLESAIAGLTAGRPVTKSMFEARIAEKLGRQ
jgi:Restriction endonuclease NotI